MRVGSKGRYAVMALADVAANDASGSVPLAEVSERQGISLSYLEQLFAMMRRSGLVISARGPGGGYRLSRAARDISIGDVFRAVEESGGTGDRTGNGASALGNGQIAEIWVGLDAHIQQFLDGISIEDALQKDVEATGAPPSLS